MNDSIKTLYKQNREILRIVQQQGDQLVALMMGEKNILMDSSELAPISQLSTNSEGEGFPKHGERKEQILYIFRSANRPMKAAEVIEALAVQLGVPQKKVYNTVHSYCSSMKKAGELQLLNAAPYKDMYALPDGNNPPVMVWQVLAS